MKKTILQEVEQLLVSKDVLSDDRVLAALGPRTMSADEIAKKLGSKAEAVRAHISNMQGRGVLVRTCGHKYVVDTTPAPSDLGRGHACTSRADSSYLFGVVGDTHLGSKYERLDVLNDLYDHFARFGVDRVFHCGNWIDGECRINRHELHTFGLGPQCDYMVERYPQRDGITTYAISGECHEGWFAKDAKMDVGRFIEDKMRAAGRSDWVNLGFLESHVPLVNVHTKKSSTLLVMHPGGGSAYAYCYDDQTEIMTKRGFKKFATLQPGDKVATLNPSTGAWEWQRPTTHIKSPYQGDMIQFGGGKTSRCDMLVTPNHRMWCRRPHQGKRGKGWGFTQARDIKGRDWKIRRGCSWTGKHQDTISIPRAIGKPKASSLRNIDRFDAGDFMEMVGWYLSEGCVSTANQQVQICQNPGKYYDHIIALATRLGFNPYRYPDRVVITSKQLYQYLHPLGRSHQKRVPDSLKQLSIPLLKRLLHGYWMGDGNFFANGKLHSATTVSPGLMADIVEIAMKCGYAACASSSPGVSGHSIAGKPPVKTAKTRWQLSVSHNTEPTLETVPKRVPYHGNVYCVTVPNGIVLVKRNGKIAWSGNSYKPQKIIEGFSGGEKPAALLIGHYHKSSFDVIRNVFTFQVGCCQDQSTFERKKQIHVAVGGWVVRFIQAPRTGALVRCQSEFFNYFDRGYYNNRWSPSGPVSKPRRVVRRRKA